MQQATVPQEQQYVNANNTEYEKYVNMRNALFSLVEEDTGLPPLWFETIRLLLMMIAIYAMFDGLLFIRNIISVFTFSRSEYWVSRFHVFTLRILGDVSRLTSCVSLV